MKIVPRSVLLPLVVALVTVIETPGQAAPKRARPPQFSKTERDVFFPNALEKLTGPRPAPAGPRPAEVAAALPEPASQSSESWSKLISAESLEDEIKSQQQNLAAAVQNATRFKGGTYQQARAHFSTLAALFLIISDYDGNVRWKKESLPVAAQLGRAGANCKVASDASFKEASQRSEDLQNLIRGNPSSTGSAGPGSWALAADRPSLMKRLDQALQSGIQPGIAAKRDFDRQADELLHEAEVIAALAEFITREGYEFADDETYVEYARAMRDRAQELKTAITGGNYEQARQAAGQLGQTCTACHEGYRSQ